MLTHVSPKTSQMPSPSSGGAAQTIFFLVVKMWRGLGSLCGEEGMHHCRAALWCHIKSGNCLLCDHCAGSQPRGGAEKTEKVP